MTMNENIDLTKILKYCPKEFKLYSLVHGEVGFSRIGKSYTLYPIEVKDNDGAFGYFSSDGKLHVNEGECILFPSKDQRDWSKFTAPWYKKEKFDPKTLKPFDRVLVRNFTPLVWKCNLFSNIIKNATYSYKCIGNAYIYCIPYNDETKHLLGTTEEAPEFYRYWED